MEEETILCAAIWYKDFKPLKNVEQLLPKNLDKGIVITGYRHGQCIWLMYSLTGLRSVTNAEDATGESEQGFLTSKNRFVDRKEAAIIAMQNGQVKEQIIYLYSENLY